MPYAMLGSPAPIATTYGYQKFDPYSISGLAAWYDVSDMATLFQNSNGTTAAVAQNDPVGFLQDKSQNGRHMTQSTNNDRPLLQLRSRNGLPSLLFDGTSDFLINTVSFLNGLPCSIAFVAQRESDNPAGADRQVQAVISSGRAGGSGSPIFPSLRNNYGTPANVLSMHGAPRRNGGATTLTGDAPTSFMIGTGAAAFSVNAPDAGDGVILGATRDGGGVIGSSGSLNFRLHGRIGELIIYSRFLSLADRQRLERYLSAKWDIPLT